MLVHARFFGRIMGASTGVYSIDAILKRLALLGMTVINPFLFALLERYAGGSIGEKGMSSVLAAIESCLFRRLV